MSNSREDQLKEEIHRLELDQERTLTELHFKKEKIDDLIESQKEMREELRKLNDTVSKLYSRTIEQDSELRERISKVESQIIPRDEIFREDIPERMSSVEATLSTVKTVVTIAVPILSLLVAVISLMLTHII